MDNLTNKQLTELFVKNLSSQLFSIKGTVPFILSIYNKKYYVLVKNLTDGSFKARPDVSRVQLAYRPFYKEIIESSIPFVILGYDNEKRIYASWNPNEVKRRLNARANISLYSRKSVEQKVRNNSFRFGSLSNGDKFLLFKSKMLSEFFLELPKLFDPKDDDFTDTKPQKTKSPIQKKLTEITDKSLIKELKPLLLGSRVLEAATICHDRYANKCKDMKLQDWLLIVNRMYTSLDK